MTWPWVNLKVRKIILENLPQLKFIDIYWLLNTAIARKWNLHFRQKCDHIPTQIYNFWHFVKNKMAQIRHDQDGARFLLYGLQWPQQNANYK